MLLKIYVTYWEYVVIQPCVLVRQLAAVVGADEDDRGADDEPLLRSDGTSSRSAQL